MFGIGTGELLLILVIAMLVVGPERMVDYARRAGVLLTKIRQQTDQVTKEFKQALEAETGELRDANALAAISELRSEADAAARDIQNIMSGKPLEADRVAKPEQPAAAPPVPAEAAPEQVAEPRVEALQPAPVVCDASNAEVEPVTEMGEVELIDDDTFAELGGPELVDEAVDSGAESEERL